MKSAEIKKLSDLKTELLCKLFDSTNSKEQFISVRSQYYKASYELSLMKKQEKAMKNNQAKTSIIAMGASNNDNLQLTA